MAHRTSAPERFPRAYRLHMLKYFQILDDAGTVVLGNIFECAAKFQRHVCKMEVVRILKSD